MELRTYQQDAIDKIRLALLDKKRCLAVAPTGSGKTVIAVHIIKRLLMKKNTPILFCVHRRELLEQAYETLKKEGIIASVIMRRDRRELRKALVYVATVQTLIRRPKLPNFKFIFVDEAHLSISKTWFKLFERVPNAYVLGLTATPIRMDGKGLNNYYQNLVEISNIDKLTSLRHLVPARVFAPVQPNLKGIPKRLGDFDKTLLESTMKKVSGDIVKTWLELSKGRKTICFAVSISHAEQIANEFINAGIKADVVSGADPKRDQKIQDFRDGKIEILCNALLLSEGWDCPEIETVILARPTLSLALYLQQIGRGLRPYPDKGYLLVLDHAGNALRHGLPSDIREWNLLGAVYKPETEYWYVSICSTCFATYRGDACDNCGAKREKKFVLPAHEKEAKLAELKDPPKLEQQFKKDYYTFTAMNRPSWWSNWMLERKYGKPYVRQQLKKLFGK